MRLIDNPFHILNVSTRDTKHKIIQAYDLESLKKDQEICNKAKSILMTPRNRLTAEISWLPTLSPARAIQFINKIQTNPNEVVHSLDGLEPLTKCNLSTEVVSLVDFRSEPRTLARWIVDIALTFEKISASNLLATINEDRHLAGIPAIQSLESINEALEEHRKYVADTLNNALKRVPDPDTIMKEVANQTTFSGSRQAPILIEELINVYQIEVQKYLDQIAEEIRKLISQIRANPKASINLLLDCLEKYLRSWDQIAQPIHIVMQSKGITDEHSMSLAHDVRDLALILANEHAMHEQAKRISTVLSEQFKDHPIFAEKLTEDKSVLEDILIRKAKSKEEDERWRREIQLDIEIGAMFKSRLIINADTISYRDAVIRTSDVDRVGWGILVYYQNNVKDRTDYKIWCGTNKTVINIDCQQALESEKTTEERYELITGKLWKAVCVRLISQTLSRLSAGEKVRFGEIVVDKEGILLNKHGRYAIEGQHYARWPNLRIGNRPGMFTISSDQDISARAELGYRDVDNVHILEAIMRFLWKDGNYQRLMRGEFL